jgi:hypothetical protein
MPNTRGELGARVAALVEKIAEMAATDHVGHHNRLFMHAAGLYAEIDADPDALTRCAHSWTIQTQRCNST